MKKKFNYTDCIRCIYSITELLIFFQSNSLKTDLSVQVVLQKCLHLYVDLSQYKNNELSFYFSRTTEIPGDSAWETILGNEESHQQEVKT